MHGMQDLLDRCMDRDDSQRPTFEHLVDELRELAAMAVLGEPLDDFERQPSRSASLAHASRQSSLISPGASLAQVVENGRLHLSEVNVRLYPVLLMPCTDTRLQLPCTFECAMTQGKEEVHAMKRSMERVGLDYRQRLSLTRRPSFSRRVGLEVV